MLNRTIFFRHLNSFQPLRKALRNILLHETLLADAGRIPLPCSWSVVYVRQHDGSNSFVIRSKLTFSDAVVREEHFVGMGYYQLVFFTISVAFILSSTPNSRLCRSLPCAVHSMKAT